MLKHRLSHEHEFVYKETIERAKYPWKISFRNYNNQQLTTSLCISSRKRIAQQTQTGKKHENKCCQVGYNGEESFQWWNFHL